MNKLFLSRRAALGRFAALTTAGLAATGASRAFAAAAPKPLYKVKRGRIKQSAVLWCFKPWTCEDLAKHAASLGMLSVELAPNENWPMLKRLGLTCAIASSHGFTKGFAHQEEHEECLSVLRRQIDACAAASIPNVITFSGMARGIDAKEARANMITGLKAIAGHAESKKVTVCVEMLNSRVSTEMKGHPDYWLDDMDVAAEIIKEVGSERVKLLFDIYHVQVMNGDVISRIKQYHPLVGHYHTAGVPGRNEIDNTQELNYAAIMKVIASTGYQGYVGQEFIPTRDALTVLSDAVRICDI
jgi:hydroxypyruvate isomerase